MSKEEWRDVVGYEGIYQVSSHGRVKRILPAPGATVGRILKQPITAQGYPYVGLWRDDGQRRLAVHRLVALAFLPRATKDLQVDHKNGDKADNRVENLEWCATAENTQHAYDVLGREAAPSRGEANGSANVTRRDVQRIRKLYAAGKHTQAELGEMSGIDRTTVSKIALRNTWKHVP